MDSEVLIDQKVLKTVLENREQNNIVPLEDLVNIEDLILTIDGLQAKLAHYENLKRKRIQPISDAIEDVNSRIDYMKKVILATLVDQGERNVNFPGIGKVIKKKTPIKWVVNDDEKMMQDLADAGEYEKVIKEELKKTIIKKELNKILSDWEKSGHIPDYVDKQGGAEGVSITFEKTVLKEEQPIASPFIADDMDGIDI